MILKTNKKGNIQVPYFTFKDVKKPVTPESITEFRYKTFQDKHDYVEFLNSCFYNVGAFEYNQYNLFIKGASELYNKNGFYCNYKEESYDYIHFWDSEKEKCMYGVIINNGKREYFYPGELYFWFNYLPIYNKSKFKKDFPDHSDLQHHISLYEYIAFMENKHAVIVKKRQSGSSYYHAGKMIHVLWFLENKIVKLLSFHEYHLHEVWDMFEEYADFLNSNTAWIRPMFPDRRFLWKQQIEINQEGVKQYRGLKSSVKARPMADGPTKGVGGPSWIVFYEEPGVSPTVLETFLYMKPALKDGENLTGQFIASGSVGELEESRGLRKMVLNPETYDIKSVDNPNYDNSGIVRKTALFIPQSYRYLPYVDAYGNSLVNEAKERILKDREQKKQDMSYEEYNIFVSQEPLTLEEAFSYRKESKFPIDIIKKHLSILEMEKPDYKCVELDVVNGKIEAFPSNKKPIDIFPLPSNYMFKEGVLQVWEEPDTSLPFGSYIAGVDPVSEGKTTTSNSLASVYILKQPTEKTVYNKNGEVIENTISPAKIVACWTGRFDDLEKTNEHMLRIIEWYKAVAVVENNVNNFIHFCIRKKKQHHLIRKNQLMFLKELNMNNSVHQEYGFRNVGNVFMNMLDYTISFIKSEIGSTTDPLTNKERTVLGIEYIKDKMVLTEMLYYGVENTDRLVALTAAISYYYVVNSYKSYVKSITVEQDSNKNNGFFDDKITKAVKYNYMRKKNLFTRLR